MKHYMGRKYRSPVCWDEVGERKKLGPELSLTDQRDCGAHRKEIARSSKTDNVNMRIHIERRYNFEIGESSSIKSITLERINQIW